MSYPFVFHPFSHMPSYSNAGGTGNRVSLFSITISPGLKHASSVGPNSNLVNGDFADDDNGSIFFNTTANSGLWVQWDCLTAKVITEAKWYQSGTQSQGTWQWQGSNDASNWTNIGSSFSLGGATTQTITALSGNTASYRYYRILGVSGSASGTPWLREIEFKIG